MAPQRIRKQQSDQSVVAESANAPALMAEPAATPDRSPSKQGSMITAAQKQALIDNLQLEITERARKLRAQYALHAQGLRSRLEMRVNRIPQSLRSLNIVELIDKYAEQAEAPNAAAITATKAPLVPVAKQASPVRTAPQAISSPPKPQGVKRSSNEMSDKENVRIHEDLPQPKKRTKTAAAGESSSAAPQPGRGVSRKVDPSKVLSPRSHNSRNLPRSPIKGQSSSSGLPSPHKSYLARPVSPLKPGVSVSAATAALAGMVEAKNTRAINSRPGTAASNTSSASAGSLRGKRGATATRTDMLPPPVPAKATRGRTASNSSNTSNTSSGTTVITKKAASRAAPSATAKRGIASKVAGMASAATTGARKATGPAAKKAAAAPTVTGGRSLRSRK